MGGFPKRLLFEGEELVLALHPHWLFFSGPVGLLVAALAAGVVMAATGVNEYGQLAAVGVALASVGWVVGRYARWATTHIVVTSRRVITRTGVLRKEGIEIPLVRVQSVRCRQSLAGRLLGCGDVVVEGLEGVERRLPYVPHPRSVQEEVYRQAHLIEQR